MATRSGTPSGRRSRPPGLRELGGESLAVENGPVPLAHMALFGYDTRAMLSRAQEARVREILGSHWPGTSPAYCLEHLAATAQIPPAHLADLAAFVRNLQAGGACETQFGGVCGLGDHATPRLLISARRIPPPQGARRVS
jgi:hypothetical protein